VKEIYVVTNNHFRGKAAANALMMQSMFEDARVSAPVTLVQAYPEALRPFVERASKDLHPTDASDSMAR
jgi:hypothetical protein